MGVANFAPGACRILNRTGDAALVQSLLESDPSYTQRVRGGSPAPGDGHQVLVGRPSGITNEDKVVVGLVHDDTLLALADVLRGWPKHDTAHLGTSAPIERSESVQRLYGIKRWLYRTGRPGWIAKALITLDDRFFTAGLLSPERAVTLVVVGRRTGRDVRVPVVIATYKGQRYLVSMLGDQANWVANVCAAEGQATLRRNGDTPVLLTDLPVNERAPVIRRYLELAPGARPHILVDRRAPLADFEGIAADYPVFRIDAPPVGHPES